MLYIQAWRGPDLRADPTPCSDQSFKLATKLVPSLARMCGCYQCCGDAPWMVLSYCSHLECFEEAGMMPMLRNCEWSRSASRSSCRNQCATLPNLPLVDAHPRALRRPSLLDASQLHIGRSILLARHSSSFCRCFLPSLAFTWQ